MAALRNKRPFSLLVNFPAITEISFMSFWQNSAWKSVFKEMLFFAFGRVPDYFRSKKPSNFQPKYICGQSVLVCSPANAVL